MPGDAEVTPLLDGFGTPTRSTATADPSTPHCVRRSGDTTNNLNGIRIACGCHLIRNSLKASRAAQDDSRGEGGRAAGLRFSGGLLAGKRALPDTNQQFLELRETLWAKLRGPLALNVAKYVVDF